MQKYFLVFLSILFINSAFGQADPSTLIKNLKAKYQKVKDYEADGIMKTNVSFMKVPIANVKIYFKNPDKLKIKNEKGVSFIPKGSVNVNMNNILGIHNYEVLDAGSAVIEKNTCRVVKIIPNDDDESDIVVSTLYIDEKSMLILKSKTTNKEQGTYEIDMKYGQYAHLGLPSKVTFSFNTQKFKMPKGITFDYDNGAFKEDKDTTKAKKGKVEITYKSYSINKGLSDVVFK